MSEQNRPPTIQFANIPMISLDLNLDSLKTYLDTISQAINQHAEIINVLQQDIQQKQNNKLLPQALKQVADSVKLYNNDQINVIKQILGNSLKQENTSNELENSINQFINRIVIYGHGISLNYDKISELESQIKEIKQGLVKKSDQEFVREKHKKMKKKLINDIEDNKKLLEKNIVEGDKKIADSIRNFDERVQTLQKNTLWKIQDLEEIVKRRITVEYVNDSCLALEEKLKRELGDQTQGDKDKIDKIYLDLQNKMTLLDNKIQEKLNANKKPIKDLQDRIEKGLISQAVFDEYTKNNSSQQNELLKKIKEIEKKTDIQIFLDKLHNRTKNIEDKFQVIEDEIQRKFSDLMLNGMKQTNQEDVKVVNSNVDPHKLCQLEGDLNRTMEQVGRHAETIQQLSKDLKMGFEKLDLNLYENMGQKSNNVGKVENSSQDKLVQLEEEFENFKKKNDLGQDSQEKLKQVMIEFKDLAKRFDLYKDLDKKMNRMFKDLDVNTLQKQLKSKAEVDTVQKDFSIQEVKIKTNTDNISYIRKDLDSLILLYKKLIQLLQQNGGMINDSTSILTTKKLYPVNSFNCLSCGSTHQGRPSMAKGSDGKQYKIDTSFQTTQAQLQFQQLEKMIASTVDYNRTQMESSQFNNNQQQFFTSQKDTSKLRPSSGIQRDKQNQSQKMLSMRPSSAKK